MGRDYSTLHAASLVSGLPTGARVWAAYTDSEIGGWTHEQLLLGVIADAANFIAWSKTKDAQHNRNKPKSVLPDTSKRDRKITGLAMTPDELVETIERIRREAANA